MVNKFFGDVFVLRKQAQKKVKKIEVIQLLNDQDWEFACLYSKKEKKAWIAVF